MKQDFIKFFKKKMYRGISLILCIAMLFSMIPMLNVQAAIKTPVPNLTLYADKPFISGYISYNSSTEEYKSTGDASNFINMSFTLADKTWTDDQLAMVQSGGVNAIFSIDTWTGVLWSWYSVYIGIETATGYQFIFPTDTPAATVYCTSFNKNFSFYENKNYWQTRVITTRLPPNTLPTYFWGEVIQPRNYDSAWGNRDYGYHDQNAFKKPLLYVDFVGSNYSTLVKTAPTVSTIISGQTLAGSTFSGGKVVTAAANANVSNPAAVTGSYAWQNASQQLTSTTTVSAIFEPKYNNFLNTSFNISVPVRAAVISLNANGGSGGSSSADGWFGSKPANIAVPTKTGYAFKGYYSAASGGTQYYDASGAAVKNWDVAADTTLYAQWEEQCSVSNISAPAAIPTGSKLALTTPTITGTPTSQGWQYSANGSSGWTDFDPSSKTFSVSDDGTYLRYYVANGAGQAYSNIVRITVNKYTPALSISATPTSTTYPANVVLSATLTGSNSLSGKPIKLYDGESYLGTSNTDMSGKSVFTIISPTAVMHSYKAVFDGDSYNLSASSSALSFTVSKGTQSAVSFASTSDITKTYGDMAFTLPTVSGGSGTGAYSYRSSNTGVATVSGNTVTIKGAGEAFIYVKKLGDTNYNDSAEVSLKVKISSKSVTISGMGANNKVYDGTDAAILNTTNAVINGVINSDAVSIDTTNALASFSDANAAANKSVTFTGFALSGSGSANYILLAQPANATATITPKSITVNGITANGKTYDGNNSATLLYTGMALTGKLGGDSLWATATGTFTNKNAQDAATTVSISGLTLGGASANNYMLSATGQQATTTAKITPAAITVKPDSGKYKYYGQSDPSLSYSSSGAVDGETPAYVGALSRATGEDVSNNYAIGIGSLALSNNGAFLSSNYQLSLDVDEVSFEIKSYSTSAVATAVPNGQNGWFQSDPVTLTAPAGYQISTSDSLSGNTWANEIPLNYTDGASKSTTYYLKVSSGTDIGAITGAKTFNYNVDKTAPSNCKATYGSNTLFKILNTVTFGLFFKETTSVTLEATDITSGVDHFDVSFTGTPSRSDITVNKSDGAFTFNISPQFVGNFTVTATDMAGNESTATSFENMAVDDTAPTTPTVTAISNSSTHTSGTWATSDIELTVSGSTADSGIAKYQYSINHGQTWVDMTTTESTAATNMTPYHATKAALTISANQNITYEFRTVSNSGLFSDEQNFDVKLDTTAPDGDIKIGANSIKTFLNKITFGLFFKQNITVTITGTDATSGIAKVEYYKSSEILDPQDVEDLTSLWSEYNGAITETTVDSSKFIYYVKITDSAGNVTYIASNGVTFDTTNPVITGITNAAVYYVDQAVAITDTNLDTITLNGDPFASGNEIAGNLAATYAITATDKAGNTTTVTVIMKPIASLSTSIDLLSQDNVMSSDKTAIEAVRSNVQAVLLTTNNGASQAQIGTLNAIITKCNNLLIKIQDIKDKIADVNTKTNGITVDNVKSSDKENLESALSTINDLLAINNLTDSEKSALEQKKTETENALERIAEVKNGILSAYNPVKDITNDNVTKTDKITLEQAVDDLQNILDNDANNLTGIEIQEIEDQIDLIEIIIHTLDEVAEVEDLISDLPNESEVTKADVDAIAKANNAYEALTSHQKELVDSAFKTKLDEAINSLKKVLLFDTPTGTRIEGVNGTVFDLRTELVVTSMINTLDKATMNKFALGVSSIAKDQQIAQLYDIKLLLDGQVIQPNGMVKITLTLTDEQANYTNLQIVYVSDDGTATIIPSTINGKEISFTTNHFSYYGIIGTPVNKINPSQNPNPNTRDNTPVIPLITLTFLSAVILSAVTKKRKFRALKK